MSDRQMVGGEQAAGPGGGADAAARSMRVFVRCIRACPAGPVRGTPAVWRYAGAMDEAMDRIYGVRIRRAEEMGAA